MGWRAMFQESNLLGISGKSERLSVPRTNVSDISHFPVVRGGADPAVEASGHVPLPDSAPDPAGQRTVTPAELDELFKLLPLVAKHYGCSDEDLAEMRTAAARDPSGALVSFRDIARRPGYQLHGDRARAVPDG